MKKRVEQPSAAGLDSAPPDLEPDHLPDPTSVLLFTRNDDLERPIPGGKGLAVAVVGQKNDPIGERGSSSASANAAR